MSVIVALDLETTGFGPLDRIVEIGAVAYDLDTGEVVAEFETLINPVRNIPIAASRVHGLYAEHLSMAPTFEEISDQLFALLNGRTMVAHNASFDLRFLIKEFAEVGIDFSEATSESTYKLSGLSLAVACERISYSFDHHSAMSDAKAALAVWLDMKLLAIEKLSLSTKELLAFPALRTLTRSQIGLEPKDSRRSSLSRLALGNSQSGNESTYIALLDAHLRDIFVSDLEDLGLSDFATESGISTERALALQECYLDSLEEAALRDGIVTQIEADLFNGIASALGFSRQLERTKVYNTLPLQGSLICVTGTALVSGILYDKATLSSIIHLHGYVFTDSISKKAGISLLIQDSEGSMSSKVVKAQAWGIPRMTIANFVGFLTSS